MLPHQYSLTEVVVHIYATGHILLSRLLLSGDIEPNPGPPKRDTIIFECHLCKKDIKGTALTAAHVCAAEDCSARCHAKCDGLSSSGSYKARTDPNTIVKWFSLDHGSGNVEITKIVPDPPQATHLINPALLHPYCDTCSIKFDSKLKAAYQCHKEGCLKAVHKQPACSGFRTPRGKKEQAAWLLKVWLCKEHNPTAQTNVNDCPLALPPPPPTRKDLMSSGLSLAEALAAKSKCSKWGQALRSNTNPVRCDQCGRLFHIVCSVGKADVKRANFRCAPCQKGNTSRPTQVQIHPDGPEPSKLLSRSFAKLHGPPWCL